MKVYEVQLGIINDGAKDGNIDYDSPKIILVESDHYIDIEETENALSDEIKSFGCDCVYGITLVEDWELNEYECYKAAPKYKM